jgi:hypothetical protein
MSSAKLAYRQRADSSNGTFELVHCPLYSPIIAIQRNVSFYRRRAPLRSYAAKTHKRHSDTG